ncbi:hypothetical protein LPAF129_07090 [Ligilactobacillus pabuli]|uniref:Uncharacterized protein n=1 Tax=Ligilactobacillus pabuli TaxID=2886039 RepID=A0ABQ5JG30_9LACO|nr:hypothetical protein [Ligilactobacillus pabuli]GKS81024.1 hypothetical protein LPAF129_07090 [Ligilactobacillus pabuli]
MKDSQAKVEHAQVVGFVSGVVFATAIHAAIALPLIALRLGAKGKHNLHHRGHCHPHHEPAGPVHFLAEQREKQAQDEHDLLVEVNENLAAIQAKLADRPTPPAPEPKPEAPEPDDAPEPPKP